jgi:hypothetical protein
LQDSFQLSLSSVQQIPAGYLQPGLSLFSVSLLPLSSGGFPASASVFVDALLLEAPLVRLFAPRFGLLPANTSLLLAATVVDPFGPCNGPCGAEATLLWTSSHPSLVCLFTFFG